MINFKINRKKGFSKTEVLLIFSLIVTIVLFIVFFVFDNLKNNAKDINIREGIKSVIKEADIFYLENNQSLKGFCDKYVVKEISKYSSEVKCFDNSFGNIKNSWAIEAKFNDANIYYCADYLGNRGISNKNSISESDFSCDIVINENDFDKLIKK